MYNAVVHKSRKGPGCLGLHTREKCVLVRELQFVLFWSMKRNDGATERKCLVFR